ncbi:MAG: zinc-binding dehydrogenase [Chloroflexi bacterium]|jgi:L-iditol 2-dehydrogenase|nr:zinc-binding dehydrogenase [Chloroflexota bacterium]MBT4072199.1 zinc-binding dehydrogenase [Chloroflexota bacterium]MBT4515507.1 zinc-binding dehydrogenase [Chloroflexota bacterium]MBT6680803.1 zinc-binding dehydrogenase [Chloroflexota bacterium]
MKAYQLTGPQTLEEVTAPDPEPKDGQVLLKIEHVSICGSDTHLNFHPTLPEEQYPFAPGLPCHEIAGTIVESKNPNNPVGQRAIILPTFDQGVGMTNGGLAELIASEKVIPLPDYGDTSDWVMCQPAGTAIQASREWGTTDDKTFLVMGQGAIGLSTTAVAYRMGAQKVIGVDLDDYRLAKAAELGASLTLNADRDNLVEAVMDATDGQGVDVVVEATGDSNGINVAMELVRRQGTIVSFTLVAADDPTVLRHQEWMRKEIRILPTNAAGAIDPVAPIRDMVGLRDRGWWDPAELITHRVGWDDIPDAYEMYSDRSDGVIKVAIAIE